ncbi:hypothetical protein BZL30_5536 [Mycobacterium kansasii]|nr:hypothetical protein BZL30_5536 [Mycobacterium kansasii]
MLADKMIEPRIPGSDSRRSQPNDVTSQHEGPYRHHSRWRNIDVMTRGSGEVPSGTCR